MDQSTRFCTVLKVDFDQNTNTQLFCIKIFPYNQSKKKINYIINCHCSFRFSPIN